MALTGVILSLIIARACPSDLAAHMHSYGNLDFGIEGIMVGYVLPDGSLLPITTSSTNFLHGKINAAAGYYLSDWAYAYLELGIRSRLHSEAPYRCLLSSRGTKIRFREAYIDMDYHGISARVGRQNLVVGTQMIVDDRFDAIWVGYKGFEIFGGSLASDVARGASFCPDELIRAYTYCYKMTCGTGWEDNIILGFGKSFIFRHGKGFPVNLSLYGIKQLNTSNPVYDGNILDVYLNAGKSLKLNGEIAYHMERNLVYLHLFLQKRVILPEGFVGQIWVGAMGNNLDADSLQLLGPGTDLNPLFGSIWLGERYRFEAGSGRIAYLKSTISKGESRIDLLYARELLSGREETALTFSVQPINMLKLRFSIDIVDRTNRLFMAELRVYP